MFLELISLQSDERAEISQEEGSQNNKKARHSVKSLVDFISFRCRRTFSQQINALLLRYTFLVVLFALIFLLVLFGLFFLEDFCIDLLL